jgi:hypothetical protein
MTRWLERTRHRDNNRFAERYPNALRGGRALQGTDTATTIRGDVVTDGPFVESKEVLGGYYLIEAADLDEALDIAKAADLDEALDIAKALPARFGGVEVPPVLVLPQD